MPGLPALASCPAWLATWLGERGLPETQVWERGAGIGLLGAKGDRIMPGIKISVKRCRMDSGAKWIFILKAISWLSTAKKIEKEK